MKKIKLDSLKVQSFITEFGKEEKQTVKGGLDVTRANSGCNTIINITECCSANYPTLNGDCPINVQITI